VWAPNQTQSRPGPFEVVDEVAGRPKGSVPSYPLGTQPAEFARQVGLPYEATQGGSATLYPEFAARIPSLSPDPPTNPGPLTPSPARPARAPSSDYEVLPVQGGVYMLAGPGGNVTVHVSEDGVLLVDTGAPGLADRLLTAVRSLSERPIRYVIDTSADSEHVSGNGRVSSAGVALGGNAPGNFGFQIDVAPIVAHENVLKRMSAPSGQQPPVPFAEWPTSTYFTEKKTLFVGDDPVEILFQPAAYSDGDSTVFFRRADVISAGDVYMTDRYPVFDASRGGSVQGVLDALNRIIDIAIPRFNQQGGTLIIPGHGRISNESDVVEYRDMVTIIRDRIAALVGKGLSLDEVKAAQPTLDYDGVYGDTDGPWSTDRFIEAIYRDVSGRNVRPSTQ